MYSSLNRLPFICPSPLGDELYGISWGFSGSTPATMTELLAQARNVAAAVDLPVLADIDDGGGTPLSA